MSRTVGLLTASIALVTLSACSDPCVDACEKVKACYQDVTCPADPFVGAECEFWKDLYASADCDDFQTACEQAGGTDCECDEAEAEKINDCDLDPYTCECT